MAGVRAIGTTKSGSGAHRAMATAPAMAALLAIAASSGDRLAAEPVVDAAARLAVRWQSQGHRADRQHAVCRRRLHGGGTAVGRARVLADAVHVEWGGLAGPAVARWPGCRRRVRRRRWLLHRWDVHQRRRGRARPHPRRWRRGPDVRAAGRGSGEPSAGAGRPVPGGWRPGGASPRPRSGDGGDLAVGPGVAKSQRGTLRGRQRPALRHDERRVGEPACVGVRRRDRGGGLGIRRRRQSRRLGDVYSGAMASPARG